MSWRRVVAAAGAALVLVACGASYDEPEPVSLPPEVTAATVPAAQTEQCDNTGPEVASYEPSSLPAPGLLTAMPVLPSGSYMEEIQQRGRLIVGTSIDTNLFAAVNPRNDIVGFDVEMAKLVAHAIFGGSYADIGSRLELRGITYAQRIPTVSSGEVDLIAHTMTINCARWQQVAFSRVYLHAGQKLLVANDSGIEEIEQLRGKRVCVSAGGTSADEMRNLGGDPPIEVTEVANQTDCVVLFQQGEVDAIRSDDTVLAGFQAQDPYSTLTGKFLTREPYGLAMSLEHPEFTQFVNAVLDQAMNPANTNPYTDTDRDGISEDATAPGWAAIYDRWLEPSLREPVTTIDLALANQVPGVPQAVLPYRPRPAS
jgi:polar amino acid transport system substrate-binding protein